MHDHARALTHERARDPETDALRRPRDERVSIGESHGARLYAACAGIHDTPSLETAAADRAVRWSRRFGPAAEAEAGRAEAAARGAASSAARNRRAAWSQAVAEAEAARRRCWTSTGPSRASPAAACPWRTCIASSRRRSIAAPTKH